MGEELYKANLSYTLCLYFNIFIIDTNIYRCYRAAYEINLKLSEQDAFNSPNANCIDAVHTARCSQV